MDNLQLITIEEAKEKGLVTIIAIPVVQLRQVNLEEKFLSTTQHRPPEPGVDFVYTPDSTHYSITAPLKVGGTGLNMSSNSRPQNGAYVTITLYQKK